MGADLNIPPPPRITKAYHDEPGFKECLRQIALRGLSGIGRGRLTPRFTGAGARSAQGTNTGHENGEAMASVGVRVDPTVRLGRVGRDW